MVVALRILCMARASSRRRSRFVQVHAITIAITVAINGVHALVSGAIGVPTPVLYSLPLQFVILLVQFFGPIVLGFALIRTSRLATVERVALLGPLCLSRSSSPSQSLRQSLTISHMTRLRGRKR